MPALIFFLSFFFLQFLFSPFLPQAAGAPDGSSPYIFFPKEANKTVGAGATLTAAVATWVRPSIKGYYGHRYMVHVGNNGFSDRLWMMLADGAVVYGSFHIIWDHLSRISQLHPTPHALCDILYLVPMLIGC